MCGQRCCCQAFIKNLQPVSMRMAKLQKATLDPSKISGRCSRLMCCLRYEDENYQHLRKKLPHKNTWVRTQTMVGRVIDTEILTQLVRIQTPDRGQDVIAVEEIVERNVEAATVERSGGDFSSRANGRGARGSQNSGRGGDSKEEQTETRADGGKAADAAESPGDSSVEDSGSQRGKSGGSSASKGEKGGSRNGNRRSRRRRKHKRK
jgi:hypothetical protein